MSLLTRVLLKCLWRLMKASCHVIPRKYIHTPTQACLRWRGTLASSFCSMRLLWMKTTDLLIRRTSAAYWCAQASLYNLSRKQFKSHCIDANRCFSSHFDSVYERYFREKNLFLSRGEFTLAIYFRRRNKSTVWFYRISVNSRKFRWKSDSVYVSCVFIGFKMAAPCVNHAAV